MHNNTKAINVFMLQFQIYDNHWFVSSQSGVSYWCNCKSDGLWNRSKRVQTPVVLFQDNYPWEMYEPHYPPPAMG